MDDASLGRLVLEVAKRELGEDDETREHSLRLFRDWVVRNPNIKNCRTDDDFLLAFLRAKKFSVNQAEQMLLKFLKCIQRMQRYTRNLDILEPNMNAVFSKCAMYASPFRDGKGRGVFITSIAAVKPSEASYVDLGRALFLNFCNLMNDPPSQVLGYVYVCDMGGVEAGHATVWPPLEALDVLNVTQQAVPLRHKEVHIVHSNPIMQVLFNMFMSIATKKIRNRIHIHATFEDLHKKVSPEVLPKEFGGTIPAKEMCELWKKKLTETRDVVLPMSDMRLLVDHEADTVETGSFRRLVID